MSTSIIRCHIFSGTNEYDPPCSLLQIDDFYCLLDCGWDSKFSDNYIHQVAKYTNKIDAVFISHSDIRYMGALPYLFKKCGLTCPVYMTSPVHRMGHLSLYDAYLSICKTEDFQKFNLNDVDDAFDLVVDVKYHQTKHLEGKGVSITPYAAGHMIGGAIWKIVKDDLEIVYAIDYNHKKDNHLNGAIFSDIQRPHLLITSSYHTFEKIKTKFKEENLKQIIQNTIKKNGNVLILSDTAGRSLELAYLLDKMWCNKKSCLMANGLALISEVAHNVFEFAKSNLEWLSDGLRNLFENTGVKPFQFRYLNICHGLDDIKALTRPMVAIVSQSHLNYGFGRELLAQICENENNLVIVTAKNREQCLTNDLLNYAQQTETVESMKINLKDECRKHNADFSEVTQKSLLIPKHENTMDIDGYSSEEDVMNWENDNSKQLLIKREVSFLPQDDNITSLNEGNWISHPQVDIYPEVGDTFQRASQRLCLEFPFYERNINWDIYGEHINIKDPNFLHTVGSSYAMDIQNQKFAWKDANSIKSSIIPKKIYNLNQVKHTREESLNVSDNQKVFPSLENTAVKCGIIYEDYEGLSDSAAIQQTLINCKPQEIIIIGGNQAESVEVAEFCRTNLNMTEKVVHVPQKGELVDCTKEGHIYQAKMSDALLSKLSFKKVGKYEVAWLDSVIKIPPTVDVDLELLANVDQIPILELPDIDCEHNTAFINEPKLSDLKQLLMNKGMIAEFNGGILVIDNCVTIRKNERGKMMLEGTISETYFDVREVLYSQFAIL